MPTDFAISRYHLSVRISWRTSFTIYYFHRFPVIKKYLLHAFMAKNTDLPSNAPVEWLFSIGGQIMTPRRNGLSDEHFEMLLLLCANRHLQEIWLQCSVTVSKNVHQIVVQMYNVNVNWKNFLDEWESMKTTDVMWNFIFLWSQNVSFNKCSCNRCYSQLKLMSIRFSFLF